MIQFYKEYNQELTFTKPSVSQIGTSIAKLPVSHSQSNKYALPITQISWAHNVIIMQRVKNVKARCWYMQQTIINAWSRDFHTEAIKLDYYGKHGALPNNFDTTLPDAQSKQVKEMLKDPYVFDMLTFNEKDFETYKQILHALSDHVEKLYVNGKSPQLNILTDRMLLEKMNNCGAGDSNITLAPNGKFYVCPAFYYENEKNCIGDNELAKILTADNTELYEKLVKDLGETGTKF